MSAPVRGCGRRISGAIYAVVGTSENGLPVEAFLVDPPIVINKPELGLAEIGVKLIKDQRSGTWHVFDIIGRQHYPNVADFVEEVRRFGVSRRLPKTLDFSKLTSASRLVLLHERAHIENHGDYYEALGPYGGRPTGHACPRKLGQHQYHDDRAPIEMCAGLWWQDIDPSTANNPSGSSDVIREMPGWDYEPFLRPDGITPDYKLAIFARFPISNLAVIRDPDGSDEEAMQVATKAGLPVTLEEE